MSKKKFLMAAVALICMTLTFVVTSCTKDNDDKSSNSVISYKVTSTVTTKDASKIDLTSKTAASLFEKAFALIVPIGNTENKDKEVIEACNKVYEDNKNQNWKGTITITKYVGVLSDTGTVIKTYTFE